MPVVLGDNPFVTRSHERGTELRRAGKLVESDLPHDFKRQLWRPITASLELLGQFASPPDRKGRIAKDYPEIGIIELRSQKCRLRRVVDYAVEFCQAVVRRIEEFVLPFKLSDQ